MSGTTLGLLGLVFAALLQGPALWAAITKLWATIKPKIPIIGDGTITLTFRKRDLVTAALVVASVLLLWGKLPSPWPPGPGPVPPTPTPVDPAPITDVTGLHVLIVEEAQSRDQLTDEQFTALFGNDDAGIREWCKKNTQHYGDDVAFRIIDRNSDVSRDRPWVVSGMANYKQKSGTTVPWLIVSNGRTGYSGELPKDDPAIRDILNKHQPKAAAIQAANALPRTMPYMHRGIRIYDECDIPELVGDGQKVFANGEIRYLQKAPRKTRYGMSAGVLKFEDSPLSLIPESEWQGLINKRKAAKAGISNLLYFPPLNQDGTNYCWCNAVVNLMRITRAQAGLPFVDLSPASVAAPVKGFRNEGGWGQEALAYIRDTGVADVAHWPPNAISRQYLNDATKENYKLYRATEWAELEPRNFNQLVSCLLQDVPVAIGLNWWRHEVTAVDVDYVNGAYVILIWNSWGDWGEANSRGVKGFGWLTKAKANPDDACCIYSPTISTGRAKRTDLPAENNDYSLAP